MAALKYFNKTVFALAVINSLVGCGSGGGNSSSSASSTGTEKQTHSHKGSVGDGPIKGAVITAKTVKNKFISAVFSDDNAQFSVQIPADVEYPVLVSSSGGTDLVTGKTPTFTLTSVALAPDQEVVNINPFTTFIVKSTIAGSGGLSEASVVNATRDVVSVLNFGLDTGAVISPVSDPITSKSVVSITKASEALAETIRRTHQALQYAGYNTLTQDYLVNSLSADLTDGVIDGSGAIGSEPLLAAVFNIISAQIAVELITDNFSVNGVLAYDQLDNAIQQTHPGVIDSSRATPLTKALITQASTLISAAAELDSSTEMQKMKTSVDSLAAGTLPQTSFLPTASQLDKLFELALMVATVGSSDEWELVNSYVRSKVLQGRPPIRPADAKLQIAGAEASGSISDESSAPGKAIDGVDSSFWSVFGLPQNITFDLGSINSIGYAKVSFLGYADGRTYIFTLEASTDKVTWTPLLTNIESAAVQWNTLVFTPIDARYLRITLTGSSNSDWVGISEIQVFGPSPTPLPDTSPLRSSTQLLARDDSSHTLAGTPVTINVLANDSIPNGNTATIKILSLPTHGTATVSGNTVVYTSTAGYTGWDFFKYELSNGNGKVSTANAFIVVNCDTCGTVTSSVVLTWLHESNPVDGYIVYYGPTADLTTLPLEVLTENTSSFNIFAPSRSYSGKVLGLNSGDQICFRVKSFVSVFESEASLPICTTYK